MTDNSRLVAIHCTLVHKWYSKVKVHCVNCHCLPLFASHHIYIYSIVACRTIVVAQDHGTLIHVVQLIMDHYMRNSHYSLEDFRTVTAMCVSASKVNALVPSLINFANPNVMEQNHTLSMFDQTQNLLLAIGISNLRKSSNHARNKLTPELESRLKAAREIKRADARNFGDSRDVAQVIIAFNYHLEEIMSNHTSVTGADSMSAMVDSMYEKAEMARYGDIIDDHLQRFIAVVMASPAAVPLSQVKQVFSDFSPYMGPDLMVHCLERADTTRNGVYLSRDSSVLCNLVSECERYVKDMRPPLLARLSKILNTADISSSMISAYHSRIAEVIGKTEHDLHVEDIVTLMRSIHSSSSAQFAAPRIFTNRILFEIETLSLADISKLETAYIRLGIDNDRLMNGLLSRIQSLVLASSVWKYNDIVAVINIVSRHMGGGAKTRCIQITIVLSSLITPLLFSYNRFSSLMHQCPGRFNHGWETPLDEAVRLCHRNCSIDKQQRSLAEEQRYPRRLYSLELTL